MKTNGATLIELLISIAIFNLILFTLFSTTIKANKLQNTRLEFYSDEQKR